MKNIFNNKWFLGMAALVLGVTAVSCEDQPDKFELTSGKPVLKYVRPAGAAASDSLLTGAYLDNLVCLVGDNLTSIHELYFNDQKAVLNTSYITDHTLLVGVPGGIPEVVTNKIYMVTKDGETVDYDFNVLVPGPSVRSMSCEYAPAGSEATIYGDYFIDDPNVPLRITLAGNVEVPAENITSITKTAIKFIMPENAPAGYMNVISIYGSGRSAYQYRDSRNILFDWDGSHGGLATGHGWRNGVIHEPGTDAGIEAIDGNYLYFGGADMLGDIGGTWAEDQFCMNYWPEPSAGFPCLQDMPDFSKLLADYTPEELQIKFECLVPSASPWSSSALQIMFTPSSLVDYSNASNSYYSEPTLARGLWNPWQSTGSFDTADKWQTVTLPLSTFTFNHEGGAASGKLNASNFDGLTLFIWHGGIAGTDCSPVVCIDNIRVVPIE
ncbi:MAG: glycan-binding surface protein [Staphylococcus sp.]|nr:glycan-binding surface protein [Staphylococcus sp.]